MDYIKDNILLKYLNGEIESSANNNILVLNDEIFKVCNGKALLNKNEMTLIVGGKGSGKSKFMYHLIKQILMNETDEEFKIIKKDDYKVICFDSEMGHSRLVDWALKNVFDDINDDYIKNELQDKLFLYSLVSVSPYNRINEIGIIYNQLQKKYPDSHFIVCIDVVSCLTDDPNANSNFGIIDKLKSTLSSSTLIATIHNSLKDEEKFGIPAGSIGTALEKLAFITVAIKKPDELKRHLVVFKNTKAEYTDSSTNNYFYFHIDTIDDIIKITGLSDSNGEIIKKKKGNTKVETDDFKFYLFELIKNSTSDSDRFRKNIVPIIMEKFKYGSTSVFNKIKALIEEGVIKEIDGELLIN